MASTISAIIQRHAQHHALVPRGFLHGVAHIVLHAGGEFVHPAKESHPDIVFLDQGHLLAEIFAQQGHQEVDLGLGPPPILDRKRIKRQRFDFQSRARFDRRARRLRSRTVPRDPRKVPLLCPPPVAVHNHRDVPRQPRQVQLFEQTRLFWRYRAERTGCGDVQRFWGIAIGHGVYAGSLKKPLYDAKLTYASGVAQLLVPCLSSGRR
jgi:hypothetical protein